MNKRLYCEVCGSPYGVRRKVIFKDFTGMFDMCKVCYQEYGEYDIEGSTRTSVLESLSLTPLTYKGTKRCYICRSEFNKADNISLEVCVRCHRKVCFKGQTIASYLKNEGLSSHGCFVTFGDEEEYPLPEEMRKVLPVEHRMSRELNLCVRCVDEVVALMVSGLKRDEVPLAIGQKVFGDDILDSMYMGMIEKRLRGV